MTDFLALVAIVSEREKVGNIVRLNGASYHPDLTKSVSHLIAAIPSGNKYDFARNTGISIVTIEWLYDSLERGMALDESFYDPKLPQELIGVGAKPSATVPSRGVGVCWPSSSLLPCGQRSLSLSVERRSFRKAQDTQEGGGYAGKRKPAHLE